VPISKAQNPHQSTASLIDQHAVDREATQPQALAEALAQARRGLAASIPEHVDGAFRGKVLPHDLERLIRLEPERGHVEGEDLVEALSAEIGILERYRLEHGPARLDV
jgi:hypothetical protein